MADMKFIVEESIRNFFKQWDNGLKPSLTLNTLSSGAVVVNSKVTTFPPFRPSSQDRSHFPHNFRRSGNASRRRRKARRGNLEYPVNMDSTREMVIKDTSEVAEEDEEIPIEPNYEVDAHILDQNREFEDCDSRAISNVEEYSKSLSPIVDEPPVLHSMEFHNSKSTSSLRPTFVPLSELNQSTSPEHDSLSR